MAKILGGGIKGKGFLPPFECKETPKGIYADRLPKDAVVIGEIGDDGNKSPSLSAQQTPVIADDAFAVLLAYAAGFDDPLAELGANAATYKNLVDFLTRDAGFDDPDIEALVTASMPYRSPTIMDPFTLFTLYGAIKEMRKQPVNNANGTGSQLSDAMVPRQDILTPEDYATALAQAIYVAKGFLSLAKYPLLKEIIAQEKITNNIDGSVEDVLRDGAQILAKKLSELAAVSFDFQIAAPGSKTESHFSNLGTVYERFRGELERAILGLRAYVGPGNQADFDKHINIYSDN